MRVAPLDVDRLAEVVKSTPFPLTSLERVVFPPHGDRGALLKAHVVDYYARVADAMLPHVRGRPLVFRRYPAGIDGDFFYTKDWRDRGVPDVVPRVEVHSTTREAPMTYLLAESPESLLWCPQAGAVEVHPWLARVGADPAACATAAGLADRRRCGLDHPDVLAFDVDPYLRAGRTGEKGAEAGGEPGLDPEDWQRAVHVAGVLRDVLGDLGLPAFVKTSGKRGLHVLVPVVPHHDHATLRAFARTLGGHVAARHPEDVTLSYDFQARRGRVFLDVNQNARGKTLAAPYSLRPTPEATVSTPLTWDELGLVDPADLTLITVPERLQRHGDPWRGFQGAAVDLAEVLAGPRP